MDKLNELDAIKEINQWRDLFFGLGNKCNEVTAYAYKKAIAAIKKQIPQEVSKTDVCPCCKESVNSLMSYCNNCGQAISQKGKNKVDYDRKVSC